MRKQKKNSKNVKRLRGCAALLLCGLLVCGMLAGCSKADVQKDTQNTGSPVEAEDILIGQDSVLAPIYFYTQPYMLKDNIKGMYYTPLGYFFFGYTTQE